MEHAEALERIETAAVEPDGLDRLMAGDTPDAAAIAGHLAGCPACTAELARIRRTSAVARSVIASAPDPDLRARTLAYVRAAGVPRGEAALAPATVGVANPATPAPSTPVAAPISLADERERRRLGRLRLAVTALAAALVIAIGGGAVAWRSATTEAQAELAQRASEVAILEQANRATLQVTAQPDARRVELAATGATGATGTLLFSPAIGQMVAIASDLPAEDDGAVYSCWFEVDGTRTPLGRMYWAGDLWSWAGPVAGLGQIPAGATFGVSLAPVAGGAGAPPVLTGSL